VLIFLTKDEEEEEDEAPMLLDIIVLINNKYISGEAFNNYLSQTNIWKHLH